MKSKIDKHKNVMRGVLTLLFSVVAITGITMFLALKGVFSVTAIITGVGESIVERIHMITGLGLVIVGVFHATVEYFTKVED